MSTGGAAALDAWLALAEPEPILAPDLPIVDPHHHFWDRNGSRYLSDELMADLTAGHSVTATVYVECLSSYRTEAEPALQPVGETAFAAEEGAAARTAPRGHEPGIDVCAGIVAYADLALGDQVERVLDAHRAAAGGRLSGIRYATAWDDSPAIHASYPTKPAMLARADIRAGLAELRKQNLSFDAWLYFTQLDELAAAADACPDLTIVLDHLGGPIGLGPYRGRREEVFAQWRAGLARVAERSNVVVKVGGLGMTLAGFDFRKRSLPPSSSELAEAWRPYVETAISLFGPERAMFESNFPVDRASASYSILWNAFKRLAADYSEAEQLQLFSGTARRVYRLDRRSGAPA